MTTCSVCALSVPRPYDDAERVAAELRRQATRVLQEAEQRAAYLHAQADQHEAQAAEQAAREFLPFCLNHHETLRLETRHLVEAARATGDRHVRQRAERQALVDIAAGRRYG